MAKQPLTVVLDNIRSAYNVGAFLRTADCAGIEEVITCGYTPPAVHSKVKKTSLGAEQWVKSTHYDSLETCINELRGNGVKIYAIETGEGSQNFWEADLPKVPTAFIFGNEIEGVQMDIIKRHRIPILEIPMFGEKESMNVANSSAIVMYDVVKRWISKNN